MSTAHDDALDKIYKSCISSGLGGDLKFIETLFSFMRRKTKLLHSQGIITKINEIATKQSQLAKQEAAKTTSTTTPKPATTTTSSSSSSSTSSSNSSSATKSSSTSSSAAAAASAKEPAKIEVIDSDEEEENDEREQMKKNATEVPEAKQEETGEGKQSYKQKASLCNIIMLID